LFFFSSRRRHTRCLSDWSSDVCSSDLAEVTIRTAVDAKGRILAKSAKLLLDGGAYSDTGSAVATKSANRIIGPYAMPNLRLEARSEERRVGKGLGRGW